MTPNTHSATSKRTTQSVRRPTKRSLMKPAPLFPIEVRRKQYTRRLREAELDLVPIPLDDNDNNNYNNNNNNSEDFEEIDYITPVELVSDPESEPETEEWSPEFHRAFVEAVFDLGVKHSSPSIILENMQLKSEMVTSERVKSHLQKFRQSKARKGKTDFMSEYDSTVAKELPERAFDNDPLSPATVLHMMSSNPNPSGGYMAAYLTCSVLSESSRLENEEDAQDDVLESFSTEQAVTFPDLYPEEENSTLGRSMNMVHHMFVLMKDQLLRQRKSPPASSNLEA